MEISKFLRDHLDLLLDVALILDYRLRRALVLVDAPKHGVFIEISHFLVSSHEFVILLEGFEIFRLDVRFQTSCITRQFKASDFLGGVGPLFLAVDLD